MSRYRINIFPAGRLSAVMALFLAGGLSFHAAAAAAQVGNKVSVGDHHLYYELYGQGSPTVVIDVGAGESFQPWAPIAEEISRTTSVLVYDRAGYGRSEPGPLPRDAKSEAADLKALLRNAKIQGPYVLVGHSLGGLNMQVFANAYPDEVCGLVLLDPPPRDWLAGRSYTRLVEQFRQATAGMTSEAESAARSSDEAARSRAPFLQALASEHREMFGGTARQVLAVTSFGNLRMVIIAAGRANPAFGEEAEAWQAYWVEESRKLSRLSTAGEFILAERSSHELQREAPELVIAAIKKLIAAADRGNPAGPKAASTRTAAGRIAARKNSPVKPGNP